MKIKSIKTSILINFFITILSGTLTFLVNKFFLENMGIKNLGLMRLFNQMIAYLGLVDLGIGTAATYSLYKPLFEKNQKKISIIMSTLGNIYTKISIVIVILGFLFNLIIPYFLKDFVITLEIHIYWTLYVLNTAISYKFGKYIALFTANQEYELTRIIQGSSKIISQVLQILIIINYQSFLLFISMMILENTIQYIFYRIQYKKKYSYIKNVKERESSITRNLINLFWHKIGSLIVFNTDYIIISKFISLNKVGIYSSYLLIINTIMMLVSIVTNVLTPRIGAYISVSTREENYFLWKKLNILFFCFGTILIYTTYKMINSFMILWIGEKYILSEMTVILIIANLFIQITRLITEIFKNGYGYFSDTHLPVIEGFLNLVVSLILVKYIGLNGVIFGTLISNIAIIVIAKPILVFKNCFEKNSKEYLKNTLIYLLLTIAVIIFLEKILKIEIPKSKSLDWGQWVLQSLKTLIISSFVSLIIFSLNKDFRNIIKMYKMKK